jgi:RNA polymerase sigma-54 factor
MALSPRLDLRQTQSLVMTPQLQQAIKLLQLSSLELSAYVETQIEQNPLLERDEFDPERFDGEAGGSEPETVSAPPDGEPEALDQAVAQESTLYGDSALDSEGFDNLFDSDGGGFEQGRDGADYGTVQRDRGGTFDPQDGSFEDTLTARLTLKDHLTRQLAVDMDDLVDRIIGLHLIDMLDEAGYLRGELDQVATLLGCPIEQVEATLLRMQGFDPPGIFARDLAECLALQLADRDRLDPPMQRLLANLEMVARCDWAALARSCAVEEEQLVAMVGEIRSLDPKPALAFDDVVAPPVTPDVIMRGQPGGGWIVELNSETLPRILVNNQYYARISRAARNREEKQYINECMQSANWLVKSLHQRATTILKVATEIIRKQDGFFVNGVRSLRPLVLRDIAEAIGMHESTVSRVTSNKFVSTPRGIYELKYFFTHAVGGSGEDAHSAEAVRHQIKGLIDAEAASEILSDDALADILKQKGIDIARRTVAKYREAMGIPSSVQRRREKNNGLNARNRRGP